jgi:hypothetical protein
MKKAVLTIAVVLFGFTAMFANNPIGEPLKTNKALKAKISQTIAYPEFALDQKITCSVWAVIRQEADGSIAVLKCDSKVGSMRDYVRTQLGKIDLKSENLETGREYTIRVDFNYVD